MPVPQIQVKWLQNYLIIKFEILEIISEMPSFSNVVEPKHEQIQNGKGSVTALIESSPYHRKWKAANTSGGVHAMLQSKENESKISRTLGMIIQKCNLSLTDLR